MRPLPSLRAGWILGCLALVGSLSADPLVTPEGPRLTLAVRSLDFGERGHLERPEIPLVIRNTGTAPLNLTRFEVSCDCIEVLPPRPAAIPPGGSRTVKVSMGSGRAMGRLDKKLTIHSDDPVRSKVTLPVSMRVHAAFRMKPLQFRFQGLRGKDPVTSTVDILPRTPGRRPAPEFLVEGVEGRFGRPGDEFLKARVEPLSGGRRIVLELSPEHPEGRIAARLRARLDGRPLVIPVTGEMFAHIHVEPTFINFSRARAADPRTLELESRLTSIDDRPFRIEKTEVRPGKSRRAEQPAPEIGVRVHSAPSGKVHRVVITVTPPETPTPRASFFGKIHLLTTHEQKPEIELSYTGFFVP